MKKTGMADVARHAGVSIATADRAINGREGVSLKSKRRVFDAIRELEYREIGKLKQSTFGRPVRLKVLTPPIPYGLSASFDLAARTMSQRMWDIDLKVIREEVIASDKGRRFAAKIDAVCANADGLALIAPDTPIVRQAIDRAVARGINVVTILSDVQDCKRHEFIGIDNATAGKCAAVMMANSLCEKHGKILSFCGPNSVSAQDERHMGFMQTVHQRNPNLRVQSPIELPDCENEARERTIRVLANLKNIAGVYIYGGGMDGAIAGIQDMAGNKRMTVVAHGLTSSTFKWLENGAVDVVIQQDIVGIAHRAIAGLTNLAAGTKYTTIVENSPIEIIIPENADSYRRRTILGMPGQ